MSDIESDEDLKKFATDPDDDIRPIETESESAVGAGDKPDADAGFPEFPVENADKAEDGESIQKPPEREEQSPAPEMPAEPPEQIRTGMFDDSINFLEKGDYKDLRERDPTINRIVVGAGWEQRSPADDKLDIDLSCFLLNKEDETRENDDFIFYNNEKALDGAVKHQGDSRTGAGEGDDEKLFIDLNGIPFDVLKIMLVLSIYSEEREGPSLGYVRDVYMRLVNQDNEQELFRYAPDEENLRKGNAMKMICLVREGPKWYIEAIGEPSDGYLNAVAKEYGIIVKEDTG